MLKGRSLASLGPDPDPYEQEKQQVQSDLKLTAQKGGWWMSFRPARYTGNRWSSLEELERLIASHSVHIHDEFPGQPAGARFGLGWGIANDLYGETWAMTKSGLFCFSKEFEEDGMTAAERTGYRGGDDAKQPIPPGEWVEYTWATRTVVDFFLFQSRFVGEYGPGEEIHVNLKVGPLAGRRREAGGAQSGHHARDTGATEPCRAPSFTFGIGPSRPKPCGPIGSRTVTPEC